MYSKIACNRGLQTPQGSVSARGEALELEGCQLGRQGMLPVIETLKQSSELRIRRLNLVDNPSHVPLAMVSVLATNGDL